MGLLVCFMLSSLLGLWCLPGLSCPTDGTCPGEICRWDLLPWDLPRSGLSDLSVDRILSAGFCSPDHLSETINRVDRFARDMPIIASFSQ